MKLYNVSGVTYDDEHIYQLYVAEDEDEAKRKFKREFYGSRMVKSYHLSEIDGYKISVNK